MACMDALDNNVPTSLLFLILYRMASIQEIMMVPRSWRKFNLVLVAAGKTRGKTLDLLAALAEHFCRSICGDDEISFSLCMAMSWQCHGNVMVMSLRRLKQLMPIVTSL